MRRERVSSIWTKNGKERLELKTKHITIINQYIGSPYHGMEYRHYYLAKHLIKRGYKVTLVSGSYSHLFSSPPNIEGRVGRETIDDIEYIWIKVPGYRSSKSFGRVWNMLCFAFGLSLLKKEIPPSHIIVSSPSLFPVMTGYRLSRKFKTKFLFEIRDIWPLTLVELSGMRRTHPLIKFMEYFERFGYRHADKVVSLLPNAKSHFVAKGMAEEKFVYLPNGIETEMKKEAPLSDELRRKIPLKKFTVAYAGTLGIANNLDLLLDAAVLLKRREEIHFILLGNGGEKERLLSRAKREGLENVTFIDAVSKDQVSSFLAEIDVAFISLLPEKIFRFGVSPNKVFEYMYAKKPVIWAIDAGNNPVDEAKCGLTLPSQSADGLKQVILSMYSMRKETLGQMGQNGYNFVIKYHAYSSLSDRLIHIIEGQ